MPELYDEYIEKMEAVLETYEKPLNPDEPVVCFDEKPVTLHADVRAPERAAPGQIAKQDGEYERCGTANVFCAVEPKAGRHFTFPTPDRSGAEFAQVIVKVAAQYPTAKTIHLVMRNARKRGQLEHPLQKVTDRLLRRSRRRRYLGPLHGTLQSQTRQLAESS